MDECSSILIVDDEVDLLEMYKDFLESEGFSVYSAKDGEEAIEVFKNNKNKIKLIISDSHMGKMSGMELWEEIKLLSSLPPKFYLSTGDANRSEEELKLKGMSRLILKPFDLDEMVTKIKSDLSSI